MEPLEYEYVVPQMRKPPSEAAQMNPNQSNPLLLSVHFDIHITSRGKGTFELRDLIALRKIRIEVVFSGEDAL